jgi:hypothetical protein
MIMEELGDNALADLIIPIMQDPTNILIDRFTVNFLSSNTDRYRVVISNTIDFIESLNTIVDLPSIASNTPLSFDVLILDFTYPIWVKIQAVRGAELSSFSNVKEAETRITQFPESITGSWGTLALDYGYIFNPQNSGDLTDYSGNANVTTLERRNSGDTYQSWVQDIASGLWGIDFASNYSALKVADSASIELNTDYTIIALVKLNNAIDNTYRIISSKWNTVNQDSSHTTYFFNQIIENHLRGQANYPNNGYIFDTTSNVTDNNLSAYSTSLNCGTNAKIVVKNQTNFTVTQISGAGLISTINQIQNISSDLFLGAFIPYNTGTGLYDWSGSAILQGKFFGYAIIKQSLTEAQIKEIHNVMGF